MPPSDARVGEEALRASVRRAVREHLPTDIREAASKDRILEALDSLEHPFDRYAGPVHVTGSAFVVGRRGLVMHLHRRLGRWMQPGGHLDPEEAPWTAAIREAEEETGIPTSHPPEGPLLVHVDVHPAAAQHVHLDLRYLLLGADRDPAPPPRESQDVRWCTWDEARALADDALSGGIDVAQAQWDSQQRRSVARVAPETQADGGRVP
jgi:8-oxo-dGTP pyrophosphatase MutT (NUDIX family)